VILDMVGDRDLSITLSRDTHPGLLRMAFASAEELGIRPLLRLYRGNILDDHVPFMQRGIPAIDLIDFAFGSAPHENDFWHTAEDTLDKLSSESLDKVGRLTIALLNRIETELLE
jgi:glutaminyl-peptide cyclotransferase